VVAPPTFEDEAPARTATREEVTAEAVSIRSDASSAFRGKADALPGGNCCARSSWPRWDPPKKIENWDPYFEDMGPD
jgi:hypothetical protein